MKKLQTLTLIISTLMVVLLFGCAGQQPPVQNSTGPAGGPPSLVGTKFSDWHYYSMAQKIAPGTITPDIQAALNVFSINQTQQSDGTLLVTVLDNQDATTNNFTLTTGETLYFSDGNPSDDVSNQSDGTLMDDHFVLVDSNGTIVQMLTTP